MITCYNFFEALVFSMFFLGIYHELYNRSMSAWISVSSLFGFVVSHRYINEEWSYLILCIGIVIMYARAMYKPTDEKIITWN